MLKRKFINEENIGEKLIVNDKPVVVVRTRYGDAVVATKIGKGTIELLCYGGDELLFQRRRTDDVPVYGYNGLRSYVIDSIAEREIFDHYNSQLKQYSGFIPYTSI